MSLIIHKKYTFLKIPHCWESPLSITSFSDVDPHQWQWILTTATTIFATIIPLWYTTTVTDGRSLVLLECIQQRRGLHRDINDQIDIDNDNPWCCCLCSSNTRDLSCHLVQVMLWPLNDRFVQVKWPKIWIVCFLSFRQAVIGLNSWSARAWSSSLLIRLMWNMIGKK